MFQGDYGRCHRGILDGVADPRTPEFAKAFMPVWHQAYFRAGLYDRPLIDLGNHACLESQQYKPPFSGLEAMSFAGGLRDLLAGADSLSPSVKH